MSRPEVASFERDLKVFESGVENQTEAEWRAGPEFAEIKD